MSDLHEEAIVPSDPAVTQTASPAAISQETILEGVKTIVTIGLSEIPVVGNILSGLVSFFWPSNGVSVWDQVRAEVESMIDKKISDAVYGILSTHLEGLGNTLKLYVGAVKSGDKMLMSQQFVACNTLFVGAAPSFQNPRYEWELSPLFAVFTQLHMWLLRDCVLHGRDWGWTGAGHQVFVAQATSDAAKYVKYLDKVVSDQKAILKNSAPTVPGKHYTDIHNYWQALLQKTIVLIDDYRLLIVFLDPVQHPGVTRDIPFKDVYSRAYGTADNWDGTARRMSANGVIPVYDAPLANIQSISIEIFNQAPRVVKVGYPSNRGPRVLGGGRVNGYNIIADPKQGREIRNASFPSPGPDRLFNIEKASVRVGSTPLALTLKMVNGSTQWLWDRTSNPGGTIFDVAVPGRMLTTLNMWTHSKFYDDTLGCIVFGFSRDPRYVPPDIRRTLYIGAIRQPVPGTTDPALRARRDAYWRDIERRRLGAK